jgi:hypothetical protein
MTKLDYQQVRDEYLNVMSEHIQLTTGSTKSRLELILDLLGLAALNTSCLHTACESLVDAPTSAAVLYQLRQGWLNKRTLAEIEDELNDLLVARLPDRIRGSNPTVAIDLTFIPYHGQAQQDENEVRRSTAKAGTTHFHVYASAYIVRNHKRVTVALAYFQADEDLVGLLKRLLAYLNRLDIIPKRLLLDRQFCSVRVIRFLEARPWQSILPVPARGQVLSDLKHQARRSHHRSYTMTSPTDGSVTFSLQVVCRYAQGRRGKHGIDRLLFAVLGQPWSGTPAQLADTYRRRFGIETGYRLMNSLRIRTTSRDPKLRLLFVVLAFLLSNLWLFLLWSVLAVPRRGGRYIDPDLFRLARFRDFFRDAIREARQPVRSVSRPISVF